MLKILKKYIRTASRRLWASPGSLANTDLIWNSNWCSRLFLRTGDHPPPARRWPAGWCRLAFHEIGRNIIRESLLPARPCLPPWARCGPEVFLSMATIHSPQPVNSHCSRPALIHCFSLPGRALVQDGLQSGATCRQFAKTDTQHCRSGHSRAHHKVQLLACP